MLVELLKILGLSQSAGVWPVAFGACPDWIGAGCLGAVCWTGTEGAGVDGADGAGAIG